MSWCDTGKSNTTSDSSNSEASHWNYNRSCPWPPFPAKYDFGTVKDLNMQKRHWCLCICVWMDIYPSRFVIKIFVERKSEFWVWQSFIFLLLPGTEFTKAIHSLIWQMWWWVRKNSHLCTVKLGGCEPWLWMKEGKECARGGRGLPEAWEVRRMRHALMWRMSTLLCSYVHICVLPNGLQSRSLG